MTASYVVAAFALAVALAVAVLLLRRGRDLPGFACLVAAPVVAALPIALWPHGGSAAPTAERQADPHAGVAGAPPMAPAATAGGGGIAGSMPSAVEAARRRGEEARAARRFVDAREAFAEVTRLAPDDADAWADLADASAAAANGDLGSGEAALTKALALDPNHLKALWLQASLDLQRKDYEAAAKLWEKLQGLVPPGSNDARIIGANLDEARALARGGR